MATIWEEFGVEVRKARTDRGWAGKRLAHEAFGNDERKGYVSRIEQGKTRLNGLTIQKLESELDHHVTVNNPLYRDNRPDEIEVTKVDRDVERLFRL